MSKKEYCYISPEGNILKNEDGLSAKAEKEAEELFSEIQNIKKENDDDDKDAEDVKDMIIDAFKEGPLKWNFETKNVNKTSCIIKSNSISTNLTTEVKGDLTTRCENLKQREGEITAIAAGKANLSIAGTQLAAGNYAAKVEGHGTVSYTGLQEECSKEQNTRKQIVFSASGDVKSTGCASAEIGVSKYKVKVKGEAEAEAKGKANFLGLEKRRFEKKKESGVQVKVLNAQTQGDVSIKSKASLDLQYGDKNKKVQGEFEGRASGSASLKVLDATVSRSKDEIKASAQVFHAEAKGESDFKAKLSAGETNFEADGKAKAEANFKLVNGKMLLKVKKKDGCFRIPGAKVELAKGKAECSAELNLKTGSDKPKKNFSAVAKLEMKGAKINALKFDARKKRDYGNKVYAKAEATGFEANIATATITGKKEGSETGVRAEFTGMKFNAGNAQVTGIDDRKKLTSTLNVNTSVDVGNINVHGLGHKGGGSVANASLGVECFNVSIGLNRSTGATVSTKLSFFNLNLTVGPPSFNVGFGFNFSIPFLSGGGGGGDGGTSGGKNGSANGNSINGSDSGNSINGSDSGNNINGSATGDSINGSASGNSINGGDTGNSMNGSDSGNNGGVFSDNNDVRCGESNGTSSEEGFRSSNYSEGYYSDGFDDNDSDDDLVLDENNSSNAERNNYTKKIDVNGQKKIEANFKDKNDGSADSVKNIDSSASESISSGCNVSFNAEMTGDTARKHCVPVLSCYPGQYRTDSLSEVCAGKEGNGSPRSSRSDCACNEKGSNFGREVLEGNIGRYSNGDCNQRSDNSRMNKTNGFSCENFVDGESLHFTDNQKSKERIFSMFRKEGDATSSKQNCKEITTENQYMENTCRVGSNTDDERTMAVEGIAGGFEAIEIPNNNSTNRTTAKQRKYSPFTNKFGEGDSKPQNSLLLAERDEIQFNQPENSNVRYRPGTNTLSDYSNYRTEDSVSDQGTDGYQPSTTLTYAEQCDFRPKVVRQTDLCYDIRHSFENTGVVGSPNAYMTPKHIGISRFSTEELENDMKQDTCRGLRGHVIYNYSIDSDGQVVQSEDDCLIIIDDPSPEAVEGIADFFDATEIPNNNSANTTAAKQHKSQTLPNKIKECGSEHRRNLLEERDEIQFNQPENSNVRYRPDTNPLSDCNNFRTEGIVSNQGTDEYQPSTSVTSAKQGDFRPKVVRQTDMCDDNRNTIENIGVVGSPNAYMAPKHNGISRFSKEELEDDMKHDTCRDLHGHVLYNCSVDSDGQEDQLKGDFLKVIDDPRPEAIEEIADFFEATEMPYNNSANRTSSNQQKSSTFANKISECDSQPRRCLILAERGEIQFYQPENSNVRYKPDTNTLSDSNNSSTEGIVSDQSTDGYQPSTTATSAKSFLSNGDTRPKVVRETVRDMCAHMKHPFETNGVVVLPNACMTPKHNDIGQFSTTDELVDNMKHDTCRDLHGHVLYNYSVDSDGHIVQSEDDCLIVIDDPSPAAVEGIADIFEATEIPNNNSANRMKAKKQNSSTFPYKISECGNQPRMSLLLPERDEIEFYQPENSNVRYKPDTNAVYDCNNSSTEIIVSDQGTDGYQPSTTGISATNRDTRQKAIRQTDMCDPFIQKTGNKLKNREPIQKSDISRSQSCTKPAEENSVSNHSDVTVLEQNNARDNMQTHLSFNHANKDVQANSNQTRKLNLRDASDYNKHLCEIMANKMKAERSSVEESALSKHNEQKHDLTEHPYDWTDKKKVKEDLIKASRSSKATRSDRIKRKRASRSVANVTTENKKFTTTDEGSDGMGQQQQKQEKKKTSQKPFGEKKNIHTIFTIAGGETRPIKYLKDNVACFAEDE